jgi:hypothetical protein
MKCASCNKVLDHVDCECKMCTFCGTECDKVAVVKAENK